MGRLGIEQGGAIKGPVSAVDNAIVRFDSTTGKLVQGYTSGAPFIADDGVLRLPAQPSVFVANTILRTNVTGNATGYTIIYDTEIIDQNGDFDGVSTFTAPVTGQYLVTINIQIEGLTGVATAIQANINTSNRFIAVNYALSPTSSHLSLHLAIVADMDADDTLISGVTVSGEALVVDVDGATIPNPRTYMSIFLQG